MTYCFECGGLWAEWYTTEQWPTDGVLLNGGLRVEWQIAKCVVRVEWQTLECVIRDEWPIDRVSNYRMPPYLGEFFMNHGDNKAKIDGVASISYFNF